MKNTDTICSQTVDILVATYNGEKYIRAQLLSLLFQTHVSIRVIVHDDGSTDKTCDIIREIARVDSRVTLIDDGVRCGGAGKNFMHLLKFSDADAVMFCDQDDIWFDNKVSMMLEVLHEQDPEVPQVVCSEAYVWIQNRGIDGTVLRDHPKHLSDFLFLNGGGIQGCATMFNKQVKEYLLRWEGDVWMHDHALALVALTIGRLSYMPKILMLYRRHSEAVTGRLRMRMDPVSTLVINRTCPVVPSGVYKAVKKFMKLYENEINQSDREVIDSYLRMKEDSFLYKLVEIVRNQFRIHGSTLGLLLKVLIRPYMKDIGPGGMMS